MRFWHGIDRSEEAVARSVYSKPSPYFTKSELQENCYIGKRKYFMIDGIRDVKRPKLQLSLEPKLEPAPKRQKKACQGLHKPTAEGAFKNPAQTLSEVPSAEPRLWTETYCPITKTEIVGNQSLILRLYNWLGTWEVRFLRPEKRKGNTDASKDDGFKRAVLISGPPGVGKTTAAITVSKELGYIAVSAHANVARAKPDRDLKSGMNGKLSNMIKELANNHSLRAEHCHLVLDKKTVLVMDEMDDLDETGIQAMIDVVKRGNLPVICICNDRYQKGFRNLLNYCMELKFQKPRKEEVLKLFTSIGEKEGLRLDKTFLAMLIDTAQRDIRQALNQLQYLHVGVNAYSSNGRLKLHTRDIFLNPFATVDSLCMEPGTKYLSLEERMNLILQDVDLVSLLIQENYINYKPYKLRAGNAIMDTVSKAADCLCVGDIVNKNLHQCQRWELMQLLCMTLALTWYKTHPPFVNLAAAVILYSDKWFAVHRLCKDPESPLLLFPAWLGKNSTTKKNAQRITESISQFSYLHNGCARQLDLLDIQIPKIDKSLTGKGVVKPADRHAYRAHTKSLDELFDILREGR